MVISLHCSVGKTALVSALLGEVLEEKEEEEKEGVRLTRCWASSGGDWRREQEEAGPRARPVVASSCRAGYQHSLALSVATQLARRSPATRSGLVLQSTDNKDDISSGLSHPSSNLM